CAGVGGQTPTGSPKGFTLQLDQSSTMHLTWSPPTDVVPDSYLLDWVGVSNMIVPAWTTTFDAPTHGPTCFSIGAIRGGALVGSTDTLCGLPGFSTLGP